MKVNKFENTLNNELRQMDSLLFTRPVLKDAVNDETCYSNLPINIVPTETSNSYHIDKSIKFGRESFKNIV